MNDFGKGAWSGIGQANGNAVGEDDFGGGILAINDIDGNEGCLIARRRGFLAIFFEPTMKRANGTTKIAGDLGDRAGAGKNLGNGSGAKIGTVTDAGHGNENKNNLTRIDDEKLS